MSPHATTGSSRESQVPKWRPIATAPKGRVIVLLYGVQWGHRVWGKGYYFKSVPGDCGEGWIAHAFHSIPDGFRGSFQPTHWMPLPEPPDA